MSPKTKEDEKEELIYLKEEIKVGNKAMKIKTEARIEEKAFKMEDIDYKSRKILLEIYPQIELLNQFVNLYEMLSSLNFESFVQKGVWHNKLLQTMKLLNCIPFTQKMYWVRHLNIIESKHLCFKKIYFF